MNPYFDTLADQKLAYLVLKKCGCTSIMAAFAKFRDRSFVPLDPGSVHGDLETTCGPKQLGDGEDWFTFTLVRDPIRRFLSFYSDKVLGNQLLQNDVHGYRANMNLDDAINIAVGGKFEPESHVIPQSQLIDAIGFDLSFVGRFEEFEDSIASVVRESGVDLELFHLNKHVRSPVLLSPNQFELLSNYYHEDQTRFGYPVDYETWCEINVEPAIGYQTSQGFEFVDEAILVDFCISRRQHHYEIELTWKVHPNHSRVRYIRVLEQKTKPPRVLMRMPKAESLSNMCDVESIAKERLQLKYSDIPPLEHPDFLCIDIYFWNRDSKKADIVNYNNAQRLVLPLPAK